ncbi:coxsackievirus and adenovirus receptor homolog [Corythoichthys intestinalis]|uniref:coxsackievirus and adenovirus receptor homolog n=1 Tax=Corythoichthys intestinalis TaxID=161448 RepID=UPI0025A6459F|nr:coxsackievirus and adenovirus receptor homolog [Corythoichthys intestinalis]
MRMAMMAWRLLWSFVLMGGLSCVALEIHPEESQYYAAEGSDVTMLCQYNDTLDSSGHIIWDSAPFGVSPPLIIRFGDGHLVFDRYQPMKGRVRFTASDPQNGDASITISNVSRSDAMTYICLVKKLPKVEKIMTLTVMKPPSQPICNLQGEFAQGNNVTLTCLSFHGESPLTYTWAKISGNQVLPANAVVDSVRGTIRADSIIEQDCGSYRCTVESLVGSKSCELVLPCPDVPEAHMSSTLLITISITVVLVILAVSIITTGCLWCSRKKKGSYNFSEKVGDVPPPFRRISKKEEIPPSLHYEAKDQTVTMSA